MADARVDYIIATLGKLFSGQATDKEIKDQVGDKKEITAFLDDARYVSLRANEMPCVSSVLERYAAA